MTNITASQLRNALAIREKLDSLESELSRLLGNGASARGPRVARRAMRPANTGSSTKAPRPAKKARRKMSPATRARIAAAAKLRWKRAKAAGKRTLAS